MYKIIFNMISPICYLDLPIFDGIIASCLYKEYCEKNNLSKKQSLNIEKLIDFDFPFKKEKDYCLTSIMFFDKKYIEGITFWRKAWDNKNDYFVDFEGKKKKIKINSGIYKNYKMPLSYVYTNKVWFYFESEDIKRIKKLIDNYLIGIGKKVTYGFGWFKDYEIIETKEISFKDKLLRPIPFKETDLDGELKMCGYKSPYWLSNNIKLCRYPILDF